MSTTCPVNLQQEGTAGPQVIGCCKQRHRTSERRCNFQALLGAGLGVFIGKPHSSGLAEPCQPQLVQKVGDKASEEEFHSLRPTPLSVLAGARSVLPVPVRAEKLVCVSENSASFFKIN